MSSRPTEVGESLTEPTVEPQFLNIETQTQFYDVTCYRNVTKMRNFNFAASLARAKVQYHKLTRILDSLPPPSPLLVREFYAHYSPQHRRGWVRGKMINVGGGDINQVFGRGDGRDELKAAIADLDPRLLFETIVQEDAEDYWVDFRRQKRITTQILQPEPKFWNGVICSNLTPNTHPTQFDRNRAELLYALTVGGIVIDWGNIISDAMYDAGHSKSLRDTLPFGSLLTHMFALKGVEMIGVDAALMTREMSAEEIDEYFLGRPPIPNRRPARGRKARRGSSISRRATSSSRAPPPAAPPQISETTKELMRGMYTRFLDMHTTINEINTDFNAFRDLMLEHLGITGPTAPLANDVAEDDKEDDTSDDE